MLEHLREYDIILASNSPRRKELLESLGLSFRINVKANVDESYPTDLEGAKVAEYICKKKAAAYTPELSPQQLLIVADTVVRIDGKVLGKPKSREEAVDMLKQLSGRTHIVTTAFGVLSVEKSIIKSVDAEVSFAELTDDMIDFYIDSYKPYDKAGSYGIQEWIGIVGIRSIRGSYVNVMGLPVQSLFETLRDF
jgi:hypothetical protein